MATLMTSETRALPPHETVLVDGHVHIHDCFDLQILFESAQRNFSSAAGALGLGREFNAVLLLTERIQRRTSAHRKPECELFFETFRQSDREIFGQWLAVPNYAGS
jgi:hypothetical protein